MGLAGGPGAGGPSGGLSVADLCDVAYVMRLEFEDREALDALLAQDPDVPVTDEVAERRALGLSA